MNCLRCFDPYPIEAEALSQAGHPQLGLGQPHSLAVVEAVVLHVFSQIADVTD